MPRQASSLDATLRDIGHARRCLRKVKFPASTRYALLTTEGEPQPDRKTAQMPSEEELAKRQRILPIMNEILGEKGLAEFAEAKIIVTGEGWKGPLEEGWRQKVEPFVAKIPVQA